MRIVSPGHAAFASVMIALGVAGLVKGRFMPVWAPVPNDLPAREVLAFLCALISLACGLGLLWQRAAAVAARVLLASFLLWIVVLRFGDIVRAPSTFGSWDGAAETAVMVAAAWVLYAWFAGDRDKKRLAFASGAAGVRIARALYGVAMIPFGLAHFLFIKQTAALVPGWLPAHVAWAYATGSAFLIAGVAILSHLLSSGPTVGKVARLAAALSTLQIGLFTLLVWVPMVVAGSKDAFVWSEFVLSTALTTAAWVVADSYRVKMVR